MRFTRNIHRFDPSIRLYTYFSRAYSALHATPTVIKRENVSAPCFNAMKTVCAHFCPKKNETCLFQRVHFLVRNLSPFPNEISAMELKGLCVLKTSLFFASSRFCVKLFICHSTMFCIVLRYEISDKQTYRCIDTYVYIRI